jgi:hypothetical protein
LDHVVKARSNCINRLRRRKREGERERKREGERENEIGSKWYAKQKKQKKE